MSIEDILSFVQDRNEQDQKTFLTTVMSLLQIGYSESEAISQVLYDMFCIVMPVVVSSVSNYKTKLD